MLITDISKYIYTPIKGAIHIGAHHAEEHSWYIQNYINPIIWIECNKDYESIIKQRAQPLDVVIIACVGNTNDQTTFNIANNGQSSSVLPMNRHTSLHPDVHYTDHQLVNMTRMIDLYQQYNINPTLYNFLNLDIQGYELEAIKGFEHLISSFEYIYTEVNTTHVYQNCALITEIDEYLSNYGFNRKATAMYNEWGDALYTKR